MKLILLGLRVKLIAIYYIITHPASKWLMIRKESIVGRDLNLMLILHNIDYVVAQKLIVGIAESFDRVELGLDSIEYEMNNNESKKAK